jgi:O-antigen ligase
VIALLLTKSLGALLSLFAAVAAALYLSSANKKKAVFFLLGFAIPIASVFLWRSVFSEAHLRPGFSGLMRLNYWKETLEISWKHLLTGQGIGNFSLPLSRYAHNSYLQLLAETGIPGLSAFLLFLGSVAVAVKKATKLSNERYLIACVFCSSLAFLFDNLVDFSFFLPEVSLLWWGIMGLLYSMCRLDTSRKPDYLPEKP